MKKIIAFLMILFLGFFLIPSKVFAAEDLPPVYSIYNYEWNYSNTSITATSSRLNGMISFYQTFDVPDMKYSYLTLDIEGSYNFGIDFDVADENGEFVDTFALSGEDFLDTNCVFSVVFRYTTRSPNFVIEYIMDKSVLRNLIVKYQSTYVKVDNPYPNDIVSSITISGDFLLEDYPAGSIKGTQPFESIIDYNFWDYAMNIKFYQDTYQIAYTDGYNAGYNTGYSQGITDGYESGYEEGLNNGYEAGYQEGILAGEAEAYEKGFSDGQKSKLAENNEKFYSGIEKWLVPAIITVILLGGFVTIAVRKRREE